MPQPNREATSVNPKDATAFQKRAADNVMRLWSQMGGVNMWDDPRVRALFTGSEYAFPLTTSNLPVRKLDQAMAVSGKVPTERPRTLTEILLDHLAAGGK